MDATERTKAAAEAAQLVTFHERDKKLTPAVLRKRRAHAKWAEDNPPVEEAAGDSPAPDGGGE